MFKVLQQVLRPMLLDTSGSALQVAISSSSHDIVAKFSVIGLFLLPVRQPRTRCQTISVIPRLAKTLLGDHWRHTCFRCTSVRSALEALWNELYKLSTYLLISTLCGWLIELIVWLSEWMNEWLIDWLIDQLIVHLIGWSIDQLTDWPFDECTWLQKWVSGESWSPVCCVSCVQTLNTQQLVYIAIQIIKAVQYLHRRHILHKDIATRNCV